MDTVRAKKHLGQHFLKDVNIAQNIVNALSPSVQNVLEIGPGTGVLTRYLLAHPNFNLKVVEIDRESVIFLQKHYPALEILSKDFLTLDLGSVFQENMAIIGNFPYHISSQILFKILEEKDLVQEMVGMFQKEVAERVTSRPNSKTYGILSVLVQAYYETEYLFTVNEHVFHPPPKVQSAVIRLKRLPQDRISTDYPLFKHLVKTAFNQRRKTLRNALKTMDFKPGFLEHELFSKRPEQLSVQDFEILAQGLNHPVL
jgi:16S rRNA (adenine1518-N6/adenine1519-N6)-dimethyltransferase